MNFKFNPALLRTTPIPNPVVLDKSAKTDALVTQEARLNEAGNALETQVVEAHEPDTRVMGMTPAESQEAVDEAMHNENRKLNALTDDNFPFDPSQLAAVYGLASSTHGCLTGAAGTGKTTSMKKLLDVLLATSGITNEVDLETYFKKAYVPEDEDDDYVPTQRYVPSICMCTFTGKASQQIKKNFPREWHGNIMTIHRMLAFYPEYFEDMDDSGDIQKKRRFVPAYTADNKLPWDIIVVDEAGMNPWDLWMLMVAAMKSGTRVYMVGDINQLPPIHGRSPFGFAMTQWPSYELTTIHRQAGENNSIVDNAWRILRGLTPKSDAPADLQLNLINQQATIRALNFMVTNQDWKSLMLEVPPEPHLAAKRIRQVMKLLQDKLYDPIRDTIITAINGHDGSTGRQLGQIPMNMELSLMLNQNPDRYIIDAGRERPNYAVGDKVMATKNDHEAGITNGMTGIIIGIAEHAGYTGDKQRYGRVEDVQKYLQDVPQDEEEFSLDDIAESMDAQKDAKAKKEEGRDRGPASHIVTVRFGEGEHALEIAFSSLSEVATLSMAYIVTCHKMQGGESPHIFTICHHVHKQMLYREWLYTAWTRASGRSVLLYTPFGLRAALNKQRIKGKTLKEKIDSFNALSKAYSDAGLDKFNLVQARDVITGEAIVDLPQNQAEVKELHDDSDTVSTALVAPTFGQPKPRIETQTPVQPERQIHVTITGPIHVHVTEAPAPVAIPTPVVESEPQVVDAEWHDVTEAASESHPPTPTRRIGSSYQPLPVGDYNPNRWDGVAERHYVYDLESPSPAPPTDSAPVKSMAKFLFKPKALSTTGVVK